MIRRSRSPAVMDGYTRYWICPQKSVDFVEKDERLVSAELTCPKTEDRDTRIRITPDACHRTDESIRYTDSDGDQQKAFKSPEVAYRFLGKSAAVTVCDGCPYATMSALEVSEARADFAETQVLVAQNDLRRAQAVIALRAAHAELNALEPALLSLPELSS